MNRRQALAALGGLCCSGLSGQTRAFRLWSQADLVDRAAAHVSRLPEKCRKYVRYVSIAALPPGVRSKALRVLGFVMNSLSRHDAIYLPAEVAGTEGALAWLDLSQYRIDPGQFDRLGELGSGAAPSPEPYFHSIQEVVKTVEQRTYWRGGYDAEYGRAYEQGWYRVEVKKRTLKTALGAHLSRATAVGLATETGSNFPIFDVRWLWANALNEPRYNEILGVRNEQDARKLAGAYHRQAAGSTVRGAVLMGEPAHRNRILEREPTQNRYGRGTFQTSFDFKTSLRGQDVVADLLANRPDAKEIIYNLRNGHPAFLVVDGRGKKLNKADADVATSQRRTFRDPQILVGYGCMDCHIREKGWIEVDDEVRALATKGMSKLVTDHKDGRGQARGEEIRQKYLSIDMNELLAQDQSVVEAAVKASTGGMTCAETWKFLTTTIRDYQGYDRKLTLAQMPLEFGYPAEAIAQAMRQAGVGNVFSGMLAGRPQRRDQFEAQFGSLAAVLFQGGQ